VSSTSLGEETALLVTMLTKTPVASLPSALAEGPCLPEGPVHTGVRTGQVLPSRLRGLSLEGRSQSLRQDDSGVFVSVATSSAVLPS
jgi:hypothetical protein